MEIESVVVVVAAAALEATAEDQQTGKEDWNG